MALNFLRIQHLRNLRLLELEPRDGLNMILGNNGAGKTSVLEAIYLLGRGRSFRSERAGPLITDGEESLELFGRVGQDPGAVRSVGIRRSKRGMEIRVDGKGVHQLSVLAQKLPQMVITPKSHEILERGPEYRRRLLDWGVFHVEPGFLQTMKKYKRVLRQRNAALKTASQNAGIWDGELVKNGMLIDDFRFRYVETLLDSFLGFAKVFLPGREITLSYKVTAESEEAYLEKLAQQAEEERRRGFTQQGPHRADLRLRFDGKEVNQVASRGEQKLLISALFLAQAEVVNSKTSKKPILLIDDLPAELDSNNRELFVSELTRLQLQAFLTGTEKSLLRDVCDAKWFHVEHGSMV